MYKQANFISILKYNACINLFSFLLVTYENIKYKYWKASLNFFTCFYSIKYVRISIFSRLGFTWTDSLISKFDF